MDKSDPDFDYLYEMKNKGLADVQVMDGVGCEKFAEHSFNFADIFITLGVVFMILLEFIDNGNNNVNKQEK